MRKWVAALALLFFAASIAFPAYQAYAWDLPPAQTPAGAQVAGGTAGLNLLSIRDLKLNVSRPLAFENWHQYTWDWASRSTVWKILHPINYASLSALSGAVNLLQTVHGLIASLSVWLVLQALHLNILNQIAAQLAVLVEGVRDGLLGKVLFLALLGPMAWFVWQGLVLRRATRLWGGAVATVLIFGMGLWFMGNVEKVVLKAGEAGDALAGAAAAATTAPLRAGRQVSADEGIAQVLEQLWAVTYRIPWAYGMYGQNDSNLVGTGRPTTVSHAEAEALHDASLEGRSWTELIVNGSDLDRQRFADVLGDEKLDHGDHPESRWAMTGFAFRLTLTLLYLVPTVLSVIMNGLLAAMSIFAQILILLLVLATPAVILIGIIPDTGWRIVRSWATALIGAFLIKGVYGFLIGLILLASSAVYRTADTVGMSPTVTAMMMSIFFGGALALHSKFRQFILAPATAVHREIAAHGVEGVKGLRESAQRQVVRTVGAATFTGAAIDKAKGFLGRTSTWDKPLSKDQKLHKAAHDVLAHRLAHDELIEEQGGKTSDFLHEVRARQEHGIEMFSNEQLAATMEQVQAYARKEHVTIDEAAKIITHQDSARFYGQAAELTMRTGQADKKEGNFRPTGEELGTERPGAQEAGQDGPDGEAAGDGSASEQKRLTRRDGTGADYAERRRQELEEARAAARAAYQARVEERAEEHKRAFDVRRDPLKSARRAASAKTKPPAKRR